MSKRKKIVIWSVVSIVSLILIAVTIYFCWPWNRNFFDKANKEFDIPGLDTSFVPQGFAMINDDQYLISGYMSDGEASRFYVINEENNTTRYFTLLLEGSDYVGHAGGVACYDSTIWIAEGNNGGLCYRISLADVESVENAGKINIIDKFETNNGADCVWVSDGLLWVGEFYRAGNYETKPEHHIVTSSGEQNMAVAYAYIINQDKSTGVDSIQPVKALSTIGLCQGVAVSSEGKIVLSTSYSISDSTLYYYRNVFEDSNHSEISVNGIQVPLWFLDNNSLINSVKIPSMSEELVIKDNNLYILFESNCKKYRLVNRVKISNVYSLPLTLLEKQ